MAGESEMIKLSTIVEIKERGLTIVNTAKSARSTIVEIKERGLTTPPPARDGESTIVEIKERGLTALASDAPHFHLQ